MENETGNLTTEPKKRYNTKAKTKTLKSIYISNEMLMMLIKAKKNPQTKQTAKNA